MTLMLCCVLNRQDPHFDVQVQADSGYCAHDAGLETHHTQVLCSDPVPTNV